jgi:hypothetical protein
VQDFLSRSGRALALAVVLGALAAQTVAIALPLGGAGWPFLRYSMYATAGQAGFAHSEVCVTLEGRTVSVQGWDLGYPTFAFMSVLRRTRDDTPAGQQARDQVAARVARTFGPGARIDVWRATFEMGPDGLLDPSPPWVLDRSWMAPESGEVDPSAAAAPPIEARRNRIRSGRCEPPE